jgi:intracellular septation protein A
MLTWGRMGGSWLQDLRATADFVLKNLAPPIIFFVVFKAYGAKPAIAITVAATSVQLAIHLVARHVISPFFLTAALFTLLFGGLDLVAQDPSLFRLAPFAQNLVLGAVFWATVILDKPIASWFARALPPRFRPNLDERGGQAMERYLRNVTLAWAAYFIAKGLLFLYLAHKVDLGELVMLRTVIGSATLLLMFGGEVLYRKKLRRVPL